MSCATEFDLFSKYYDRANYKIEEVDRKVKKCLICFSSHATWYPFTQKAFVNCIVKEDRYEFIHILSNKRIRKNFGRIIYVRDIYCEWYVKGINSRQNSIEKIVAKMAELTKGYQVITMGNSAGGYMAVIVGIKLNAQVIYNFSGQYSLEPWIKRPWLSMYASDEMRNKYYNIVDMVKKSEIPIIYCYPAKSRADKLQAKLVKDCDNVISFAFDYSEHGHTVSPDNYKYLLRINLKKLKKLSLWLSGRTVDASGFLILTGGIGGCVDNMWNIIHLLKGKKTKKRVKGNGKVL